MTESLRRAKEILEQESYTCVIVKEDKIYMSRERGVKPLLEWLEEGTDMTSAASADKVIGKAAAYIYVKLNIGEIYTNVISRPAYDVLNKHEINVYYNQITDAISNRANTGFCPMETAVMEIDNPDEALAAIKKRLAELAMK